MNRFRKLKIALYLAGIFLAGAVTGVFISFQVMRHMMPNQARIAERMSQDLQSKLNLTPEQMGTIKPVIEESINGFKSTLGRDTLASLSNCDARIEVELTPEQKAKFAAMEKDLQDFIRSKMLDDNQTKPK